MQIGVDRLAVLATTSYERGDPYQHSIGDQRSPGIALKHTT